MPWFCTKPHHQIHCCHERKKTQKFQDGSSEGIPKNKPKTIPKDPQVSKPVKSFGGIFILYLYYIYSSRWQYIYDSYRWFIY